MLEDSVVNEATKRLKIEERLQQALARSEKSCGHYKKRRHLEFWSHRASVIVPRSCKNHQYQMSYFVGNDFDMLQIASFASLSQFGNSSF